MERTIEQNEILNIWAKTILFTDSFSSFTEQKELLISSLEEYFRTTDRSFVCSTTKDFLEFLEERIGKFEFTINVAMKLKPETMVFVDGKVAFNHFSLIEW